MRPHRIGLTVIAALLAAVSTPLSLNFPVPLRVPAALAQSTEARKVEAERLLRQGLQQSQSSQFQAAIQSWQQALSIYREIGERRGEGTALIGIGGAYAGLGDLPRAIDFFEQSLLIARELNDRQLEALAQQLISQAQSQNSPQKAEADRLLQQGSQQFQSSQFQAAIQSWQQALSIYREIGHRNGEAASLGNLGNAYHSVGQYAKAIESLQQSLTIQREISDRNGEASSLANLGNAYNKLGQYSKAIEFYQQSLPIVREIGDRNGEAASLNNLGLALLQSGKLAEAETTLRDGIKIWESIRADLGNNDANKISIFEEQAITYRLLQKVLISQNKINDALEISERGRARAFVELLAQKFSSQSSPVSSNQQATTLINPPSIVQIQQIAKQQNATLVEYSIIFNEELYIWVIKPTGEIAFRRVDLKSLNTSLQELVTSSRVSIDMGRQPIVGTRPRPGVPQKQEENLTQQLQKLHQILIEPIADQLPTDPNAKVIFIPQQSLFLVPFAALQDKAGKYLIEKHTILTAPSIQVLEFTRQQREKVRNLSLKDILIVGNPTMPSVPPAPGEPPQRLSPLDGAENEAMEIARLLNAAAMTGNQATKAAVLQKLPGAKLVHLATHGLLDDFGDGLPGAIALAPANGDSGLLTTREILDLKFNAELVVLSACNTGSGQITGDGVVGLSRALIYAGVPSLVVSLWAVPDSPTADLMTEFYRQLQQTPNKATALRQAMLATMKQHPHPRSWAAFTLIGEAE